MRVYVGMGTCSVSAHKVLAGTCRWIRAGACRLSACVIQVYTHVCTCAHVQGCPVRCGGSRVPGEPTWVWVGLRTGKPVHTPTSSPCPSQLLPLWLPGGECRTERHTARGVSRVAEWGQGTHRVWATPPPLPELDILGAVPIPSSPALWAGFNPTPVNPGSVPYRHHRLLGQARAGGRGQHSEIDHKFLEML